MGASGVVLHRAGQERTIQTGVGPIRVAWQKVRDRATDAPPEKKIRFTSSILPRWARRSRSLDALLPVLYLRGVSTGPPRPRVVGWAGDSIEILNRLESSGSPPTSGPKARAGP